MNSGLSEYFIGLAREARAASRQISRSTSAQKSEALRLVVEEIDAGRSSILVANEKDMEAAKDANLEGPLLDRLSLDLKAVDKMIEGIIQIDNLTDPVGEITDLSYLPSGIQVGKMRVALGVIAIVYESRPNVTLDAAALCLKSGNPLILRGGSESYHSSSKIVEIINQSLRKFQLPEGTLQNIPTKDRLAVGALVKMDKYVDVIIPRGGRSLIERVSDESRVHVFKHLDGICHTYIHKSADKEISKKVTLNAKMRRPGICGATETILCDKEVVKTHLPGLIQSLSNSGCEVRGDEFVKEVNSKVIKAETEDWKTEYLDKIVSIKTVNKGVEEAVDHINHYGSGHTDAIISNDEKATEFFLNNVDSGIVMHNTSTQFADGGEFGMGAEIGISTSKVHARGPVGVAQLTSFKYKVRGKGQVRP